MPSSAKNFLALALDNIESPKDVQELVVRTKAHVGIYKIGLELFSRFGPQILTPVKDAGAKLFLDLKFHDIPNTAARATKSVLCHEADYLTIHTFGGKAMLEACVEAAAKSSHTLTVLGVTVLTSIGPDTFADEIGIQEPVPSLVKTLSSLAVSSGCGGIVCSASDLRNLKNKLPTGFTVVTPGIRMKQNEIGDQARVCTPEQAIALGATILVVGRPINSAKNPAAAAESFHDAISKALDRVG